MGELLQANVEDLQHLEHQLPQMVHRASRHGRKNRSALEAMQIEVIAQSLSRLVDSVHDIFSPLEQSAGLALRSLHRR